MQRNHSTESKPKSNPISTQIKQALCGGIAGSTTRFITQPFDVLKIRFQMQVEPISKKSTENSYYTSMFQAFKRIYKEEGLHGLWRGHNSAQVMSISYALMQFWSYEQLLALCKHHEYFTEREYTRFFLCGGTAGCLGVLVSQPFDTVRTRVVASDQSSPSSQANSFRGILNIFKKEGMKPLFRGTSFTLLQVYPLVGINFVIYKYLNRMAAEKSNYPNKVLPNYVLFVNGGISGTAAKALMYPLDFLKKRLQLVGFEADRQGFGHNARCITMYECIVQTLKVEGFSGFYKGMSPTLVKSGFTSAIYFSVYDNLKRFSQERYPADKTKNISFDISCKKWQ